ncbi:putative RNA recognition motif domain, nucleotide-binding alpha-beta plait domain superfamily [Helianthus anomalus]
MQVTKNIRSHCFLGVFLTKLPTTSLLPPLWVFLYPNSAGACFIPCLGSLGRFHSPLGLVSVVLFIIRWVCSESDWVGSVSVSFTKFFVSNLPEGCTPWELRRCLEGFGEVSGTYVAKKRDKVGSRFGFASFANVKDRNELEKSLNGVKMGACKLKRYEVLQRGSGKSKVCGFPITESRGNSGFNEKVLVVPNRTLAFKEVFGVALVGKTVDLETLVDFDRILRIVGTEYERIQYLGGLSILISFRDEEVAKKFLEARTLWGLWFTKLETWCGQSLSLERAAWLKIHGVPLHILEPGILVQIGEVFGKVLHVPKLLANDQDLSVCRIGILVDEIFRTREIITLKWKNRCYRVWVEEEEDDFLPDCIQRIHGVSLNGDSPMNSSPVHHVPINQNGESEESRQVDSQEEGEKSG